MNRDKGIYNLSHVYHLAFKIKINTTKVFGTESNGNFPSVLCLNSNNISPEEAECLAYENVEKNPLSFQLFWQINFQFIDIYQTWWTYHQGHWLFLVLAISYQSILIVRSRIKTFIHNCLDSISDWRKHWRLYQFFVLWKDNFGWSYHAWVS